MSSATIQRQFGNSQYKTAHQWPSRQCLESNP
ncbi:Uncharacterized protein APZ42_014012 [Daphnia magna]|uniref:Uncharacterized protein n=1 Tax=Daphnia magna TaxID=35525 RepID=A0A162QAW3_9CRUS|nr:Uncharacterized protein APZ42_014012 [Daphnia magna]